GLAITFDMMMTTTLLTVYLATRSTHGFRAVAAFVGFISIELAFLVANLEKFPHGGWVTFLIGVILFVVMWSWYSARKIRNRLVEFVPLADYFDTLHELSHDTSVSKYATNLVYLTSANNPSEIEWKVIYSLFYKQPKRADVYWLVHIDVTDEPYTMSYKVDVLVPNDVIRIEFKLGFRVEPKVNQLFRKVVSVLVEEGIVDITSRYASLHQKNILGDFRFIVFDRILSYDNELNVYERVVTRVYKILKWACPTEEKSFGLDTSIVEIERVPLIVSTPREFQLERLT
ncbi:MAG TPA: KUP/HAK/KT family potassium transporter, partial [Turneriella sp.]|nr:KUP/HAK/KT family potassium transporter [Turneriella sp.]